MELFPVKCEDCGMECHVFGSHQEQAQDKFELLHRCEEEALEKISRGKEVNNGKLSLD